jgi:hypothetical protein
MPHVQLGQLQVGCARAQVQLWPSHITPWHPNLHQTMLCGPDHQEGNWDWATTKQHEEEQWSDLKQVVEPSHSVPETGDKASPGWLKMPAALSVPTSNFSSFQLVQQFLTSHTYTATLGILVLSRCPSHSDSEIQALTSPLYLDFIYPKPHCLCEHLMVNYLFLFILFSTRYGPLKA